MTRNEEQRDQERVAELCRDMEPILAGVMTLATSEGVRTTALISVAVSLKRIADSIAKLEPT